MDFLNLFFSKLDHKPFSLVWKRKQIIIIIHIDQIVNNSLQWQQSSYKCNYYSWNQCKTDLPPLLPPTQTHTYTHVHTYTHTHTHVHTHTHTHMHISTHTHTHTHTSIYPHTHTHTHKHTHTLSHTHTRTHAHIHTHTFAWSSLYRRMFSCTFRSVWKLQRHSNFFGLFQATCTWMWPIQNIASTP